MPAEPALVQHVLMTADPLGGVFTYAVELAAQLARRGVRTTLATMGGPLGRSQRAALARVPSLAVEESTFKLEWMEDPWRDVAAAGRWLLELEERVGPDVVHVNGFTHGALAWRAPALVVAHSCVLSWWRAVLAEAAPPKYRRYRFEVALGLWSADAIVAPTRAMLLPLAALYGADPGGTVIPNGLDPAPFGIAPKEPFVLSAGRLWDQAKNLGALAQAARRLSWPVYVAGAEASPDAPPQAVAMHRGVRALGWLEPDALRRWMARASIYALPARYEPFGLSALEAALSRCALVLGDIPSLREVWRDAAVYVAPDDVDGLAAAISRLAADDRLRERMASAARSRALCFGAEGMADRYFDLYRGLVARGRARRRPRLTPAASCAAAGGSTGWPCG